MANQRERGLSPRVTVEGAKATKLFREVAAVLSKAALDESFDSRQNSVSIVLNTQDPESVARMNLDVFNTRTRRGAFFALSADFNGYRSAGDYWPQFDLFAELTEVKTLSEDALTLDERTTSTLYDGIALSVTPYSLIVSQSEAKDGEIAAEPFSTERNPVKLSIVLELAQRAADIAVA